MAVYMTKTFARFSRKAGLPSDVLLDAAAEVVEGRYEADLGGGVFKKRVARTGAGKSGGFRTVLFFRRGSQVFFADGFAKNQKSNLTQKELAALKRLAEALLRHSADDLAEAVAIGELIELERQDGDHEN